MSIEATNYYIDKLNELLWDVDDEVLKVTRLRDAAAIVTMAWSGVIGEENRRIRSGETTKRVHCPAITNEEYEKEIVSQLYQFLIDRGIDPKELEKLRDEDGENFGYMIPEEMEIRSAAEQMEL